MMGDLNRLHFAQLSERGLRCAVEDGEMPDGRKLTEAERMEALAEYDTQRIERGQILPPQGAVPSGLVVADLKDSAETLRQEAIRFRGLRLGERVTRVEQVCRDMGFEAKRFADINTRMTVIETALTQIIEEQRRPWWRKLLGYRKGQDVPGSYSTRQP